MNLNIFKTTDRKQTATAFNPTQAESRAEMVESIADLKSERADKLEPLNADLLRSTTALENAQQALILAQAKQHSAEHKVRLCLASYKSQVSRIERKLLACAPDNINELIELIKNEQRELSQRPPLQHVTGVNQKAKERSKARNLRIQGTTDRLELLRGSIAQAEALKLSTSEGIAHGLQTISETLDLPPMASMQ